MRDTIGAAAPARFATLPGAGILLAVRRLLLWALGAGWAYWVLVAGERTVCWQGVDPHSAVVTTGPVPADPGCSTLTLAPSGFVYAGMALVALWAVTTSLRRAATEEDAVRLLERARLIVCAVAGVSLAAAYLWLFTVPLDAWGIGTTILPFLFADVTLTTPGEVVSF